MAHKIRVLVAEDSEVQATLICAIIDSQPDMEVIGRARNGREAIELAATLHPDIVTMDIEMPEIDGLEATRQIMRNHPTPIVILSSYVNDEAMHVPFHSLDYGALAVLQKPGDMNSPDFSSIEAEFVEVVRAMSEVKVVMHRHKPRVHRTPWGKGKIDVERKFDVVALGCSTGGPIALREILNGLPSDFSLPIVVVQHMFQHFTLALIAWLSKQTQLKLKLATEDEKLQAGCVYFAPYDYHLQIVKKSDGFYTHLARTQKFLSFRPSVTVLFNSLAESCHGHVVAGVLTGLGDDGAEGLKSLHEKGALTFAQKPESCVVSSMPEAAIKAHAVEQVIALEEIASMLLEITKK